MASHVYAVSLLALVVVLLTCLPDGVESQCTYNFNTGLGYKTCKECTGGHGCVWCKGQGNCVQGGFTGAKKGVECDGACYGQCYVSVEYFWILILACGVVILLCATICFCCALSFWCTSWSVKDFGPQNYDHIDEKNPILTEDYKNKTYETPNADARRDEMRRKYGIGKPEEKEKKSKKKSKK